VKILVVEDEAKIASFIKRGLKEEGFSVDTAKDGEEGHFLASTNDYDLIILDIMLPKMDGLRLCEKLRKEGIQSPVIILSARDEVRDKVQGLNLGADDYLTKPFEFEELLARVRAHLRKKKDGDPKQYEVADLVLDLAKQTARRGKENITLTTREFSLLEYLMRHAGQVVNRTMLAEHVWDTHFDSSSNVIDVYINYLRVKIDGGHAAKLIHTVRGRGYMLKQQ